MDASACTSPSSNPAHRGSSAGVSTTSARGARRGSHTFLVLSGTLCPAGQGCVEGLNDRSDDRLDEWSGDWLDN